MSCQYKYHCYPHVLHHNEVPDKEILAEAVAAHLAKRNNISSTDTVAVDNNNTTDGTDNNNNSSREKGTSIFLSCAVIIF
jgi:hypothetical protein